MWHIPELPYYPTCIYKIFVKNEQYLIKIEKKGFKAHKIYTFLKGYCNFLIHVNLVIFIYLETLVMSRH